MQLNNWILGTPSVAEITLLQSHILIQVLFLRKYSQFSNSLNIS